MIELRSRQLRRVAGILALTAGLALPAEAEIRNVMIPCHGKLCARYEALLTPPDGWIEDKSDRIPGIKMYVPQGQTASTSEVLIYSRASHNRDKLSLADQIAYVQQQWRARVPDAKITHIAEVVRANGKSTFAIYRFENPSRLQQAVEWVSYTQDPDGKGTSYFVTVVMTGPDVMALERTEEIYRAFLRGF